MKPSNNIYWLVAILVLGGALRLVGITTFGIWGDEQITVLNTNGMRWDTFALASPDFVQADLKQENTFSNLLAANVVNDGSNTLVYKVVMRYWIAAFGVSELALRFPSFLFGLLSIWLVYKIALQLSSDKRIALLSAFIVAMLPWLIRYSQEARPYALSVFLVLWSTLLFLRIVQSDGGGKKLYIGYFIAASLAFFSHYLCLPIIGAHFLYLLFFKRKKVYLTKFALVYCGMLGLLVLFAITLGKEGLPHMASRNAEILAVAQANAISNPTHAIVTTSLKTTGFGVVQLLFFSIGNHLAIYGFQVRVLIFTLLIPVLYLFGLWRAGALKQTAVKYIFITIGLALVFTAVSAFSSGHVLSWQARYNIWFMPFVSILCGWGMYALWQRNKAVASIVFAAHTAIMVFSLGIVYYDLPKERRDNAFALVAEQIEAKATPTSTIVFSTWRDAQLVNMYLSDGALQQRVEQDYEKGEVYLQDADGQRELLFDLKDNRNQ